MLLPELKVNGIDFREMLCYNDIQLVLANLWFRKTHMILKSKKWRYNAILEHFSCHIVLHPMGEAS